MNIYVKEKLKLQDDMLVMYSEDTAVKVRAINNGNEIRISTNLKIGEKSINVIHSISDTGVSITYLDKEQNRQTIKMGDTIEYDKYVIRILSPNNAEVYKKSKGTFPDAYLGMVRIRDSHMVIDITIDEIENRVIKLATMMIGSLLTTTICNFTNNFFVMQFCMQAKGNISKE